MPYYDSIEEDLARAKQILKEGKDPLVQTNERVGFLPEAVTIYGKDTYAAYKLLESFVAEVGLRGALLKRYLDNHCQLSDQEGMSTLCECKLCMETRKAVGL